MTDLFASIRELPNLHPLVVHFPIALLVMAPLVDLAGALSGLLAGSFRRAGPALRWAATLLFILGAAAAGLAVWSGEEAAESVLPPVQAETLLADHESWAERTIWIASIYALLRLAAAAAGWLERSSAIRAASVAGGILVGLCVAVTGDRGGRLVFVHAVGVRAAAPAPPSAGPGTPEGPLPWGLDLVVGSPQELEATSEPSPEGETALVLTAKGGSTLILLAPGPLGDVEVGAELDRGAFEGRVGLVFHFDEKGYDLLEIAGDRLSLLRVRGEAEELLAESSPLALHGMHAIRAVAARSHLRGYLAGKMAAHGHAPAAAPGRAGILLDGRGTLKVRRFNAEPLPQERRAPS